ncbi:MULTISPECIES: AAA family ATPase [Actinoalloteichus]|uniref:DUF3696 domain-containing protein n=1 Tax=Actinoalloteichus fjordicus TaxID=1612552 RepID=A0AAC9LGM0_9PSEU|nr:MULTISPECIES: DUF3696 domain-containing protein [Actinoalloteichus]APU17217.1 hypothetical protein UA74_26060 [Actinoalloteichus fjordicus]APU23300.1 hypothetical protein UA75_26645 [Actinoalloteichus sp. GBA129-24]
MLRHLTLRHFKAFATLALPLGPFTLLSGLNSSGKSSVLQAIALLRQSFTSGVLGSDDTHLGLLLNGEFVELGRGQDVRHEAWSGAGEIEIGLADDSNVSYRWSAGYGAEDDLLELTHSPAEEVYRRLSPFADGFQYLRADRISPAVSYPRSHDAAVRRRSLGARGEHTVNYLRNHQDDSIAGPRLRHPTTTSTTLLSQAEAWLGHLCPGASLSATGIDGTDSVRLSYQFGGGAGLSSSNPYRPTNVGFGLTYALPIIVACLTAVPGSLIMLENPEAHLHPRGQSMMTELACRAVANGAQLIVETHSDHVLNAVRLAVKRDLLSTGDVRLHYFEQTREGPQVRTPELKANGALTEWPDGFFDEWDRSLDELLD